MKNRTVGEHLVSHHSACLSIGVQPLNPGALVFGTASAFSRVGLDLLQHALCSKAGEPATIRTRVSPSASTLGPHKHPQKRKSLGRFNPRNLPGIPKG